MGPFLCILSGADRFMIYDLLSLSCISLLNVCVAMGLAAIEVMQAMQRTWSNSKVRVNGKTRQLQWRDMFDIAVKWRRSEIISQALWVMLACVSCDLEWHAFDLCRVCVCRIADPDQPVLWLDQMPARSLSRGFNNHINLIRCLSVSFPVWWF